MSLGQQMNAGTLVLLRRRLGEGIQVLTHAPLSRSLCVAQVKMETVLYVATFFSRRQLTIIEFGNVASNDPGSTNECRNSGAA